MKIRDFKYTPEDVDCRYCMKFIRGRCRANGCPWLNERIEAGVIGYTEALEETFLEFAPLRRRVKLVSACSQSFWKDEQHKPFSAFTGSVIPLLTTLPFFFLLPMTRFSGERLIASGRRKSTFNSQMFGI